MVRTLERVPELLGRLVETDSLPGPTPQDSGVVQKVWGRGPEFLSLEDFLSEADSTDLGTTLGEHWATLAQLPCWATSAAF